MKEKVPKNSADARNINPKIARFFHFVGEITGQFDSINLPRLTEKYSFEENDKLYLSSFP